MRRSLVGHHIEALTPTHQFGFDLCRVTDQSDQFRPTIGGGLPRPAQALVDGVRQPVDITDLLPASGARLVDLDDERHAFVHRNGQRLRTAHPAQAGGQDHAAAKGFAEMLASELGKRLVRALQDALRADVDPRARRHLPVHRQALPLELPERVPVRPLADQVGIGNQHPGCPLVRAKDANGFARLD